MAPVVLAPNVAPDEPEAFHQPPVPHDPKMGQLAAPPHPLRASVGRAVGVAGALAGLLLGVALGGIMVLMVVAISDRSEGPTAPKVRAPGVRAPGGWQQHALPWPSMDQASFQALDPRPSCTMSFPSDAGGGGAGDCPPALQAMADQVAEHLDLGTQPAPLRVQWADKPDAIYLLESTSTHTFRPGPSPVHTVDSSDLQPFVRVAPSYPKAATSQPLADMRCEATVRVGADGQPDAVTVEGCPVAFHSAATQALAQWRWTSLEAPVQTTVGITFKKR